MKFADVVRLLSLAALWGASFLLMRLCVADFGPLPLAGVRVVGATLFLIPLMILRGEATSFRKHWKPICCVGVMNSAIPFLCYSFAAVSMTAGLSSLFNAATPLFGALIGWLWLADRLNRSRTLGLVIGFSGVLFLAWDGVRFKPDVGSYQSLWAVAACLLATLCYGFSANFTKRNLTGVPPLTIATGSLVFAAIALCIPTGLAWPVETPSITAWLAATFLAVVCTGVAYVVFFRLIGNVGPTNAMAVTFLIPLFAIFWGWLWLNEYPDGVMAIGCGLILTGTSLSTGLVSFAKKSTKSDKSQQANESRPA